MTNTTELRKRWAKNAKLLTLALEANSFRDARRHIVGFTESVMDVFISEIEAAEKARTEAIIDEIEQRYKDSLGIGENPLVKHLRSKFLNNP